MLTYNPTTRRYTTTASADRKLPPAQIKVVDRATGRVLYTVTGQAVRA